jgi:hypothetical protein
VAPGFGFEVIAPEVFKRRAMREAIDARDLGTVYRLLLRQGYSLHQLGVITEQTQSEVSAIVAGRLVVSEDRFVGTCLDLGMWPTVPGIGKGLTMKRHITSGRPDPEIEKRRMVVACADAGTVGVNIINHVPVSESLGQRMDVPDRLRLADVCQIESVARTLRSYGSWGSSADKQVAKAHVEWGRALVMAPSTQPLRERLQVAMGVLEAIVAEGQA